MAMTRRALVAAVCSVLAQAAFGQYAAPAPMAMLPTESDTAVHAVPPVHQRSALQLREMMLGAEAAYGPSGPDGPNPDATPPPTFRALFCRFDDDLDARKIPLRIRAGDIDAINRLEGKPGY